MRLLPLCVFVGRIGRRRELLHNTSNLVFVKLGDGRVGSESEVVREFDCPCNGRSRCARH